MKENEGVALPLTVTCVDTCTESFLSKHLAPRPNHGIFWAIVVTCYKESILKLIGESPRSQDSLSRII